MNKDDYRKAFEEVLLRLARREIRLEAVIEGKAKLPQPPCRAEEGAAIAGKRNAKSAGSRAAGKPA